jgi:hypothetical protein
MTWYAAEPVCSCWLCCVGLLAFCTCCHVSAFAHDKSSAPVPPHQAYSPPPLTTKQLPHNRQAALVAGRPGVGKTTAIREISRKLADECRRRVVIVDTSNEIGGDGDIPHPGIGSARRMQVHWGAVRTS